MCVCVLNGRKHKCVRVRSYHLLMMRVDTDLHKEMDVRMGGVCGIQGLGEERG